MIAACGSGDAAGMQPRTPDAVGAGMPAASGQAGERAAAGVDVPGSPSTTAGQAGSTAQGPLAQGAGSAAPGIEGSPPEMTGVIFDWPETDPDAPRNCKPGRYVGEYSCRLFIVVTEGDGAFDVSGTIDMQLEQTPDGELLRIADGRFESATLAAIPMSADIVGELDCASSRFEGRLENGIFSVALALPIPFTEGTFAGPIGSDYDPATASLDGRWDMMGELDGVPGTCMNGSWSAHWVE